MFDTCTVLAPNEEKMRSAGSALAKTLYKPLTICLRGELGAGKTTFVQGLAAGLGITQRITSPTYALEQRYGSTLSHIDLYRLTPAQATDFQKKLDDFPGFRVIEWSDRSHDIEAGIEITITEQNASRSLAFAFRDIVIPTDHEIETWMQTVRLPEHIQRHVRKVAAICDIVADALVAQGRIVRKKALFAAALTHDLLRFVDFASLTGDAIYSPTQEETDIWTHCKKTYGTPHEAAAERFLIEHGFPEIGRIVRTHRGHGEDSVPETVEQYALTYADKRALIDQCVTIDQRFDDFILRYGKGKESALTREWRQDMKRIEGLLFPDGVMF